MPTNNASSWDWLGGEIEKKVKNSFVSIDEIEKYFIAQEKLSEGQTLKDNPVLCNMVKENFVSIESKVADWISEHGENNE